MSPLRRELEKHLKEMCQELGFKKNRGGFYVKQIDDNAYGTLGFVLASFQQKGHIFVSFLAGVSFRPLEELFWSYDVTADKKAIYPTLSYQIGYLTPARRFFEWDYYDGVNAAELFDEIKETIVEYAYPFFHKYSNCDEVLQAFLDGDVGGSTVSDAVGRAILYYLKGQPQKALESLDEGVANKEFRSVVEMDFADNLRKILNSKLI